MKATPYDNQMARIRPILTSLNSTGGQNLSLAVVNHWIEDLRSIPYVFSTQWMTPAEVERAPAADCKGKSVLLYQLMCGQGATNVRLVIGKRAPASLLTHTWVEWTTRSATYVLDPTINRSACSIRQIPSNSYIPYYVYAGAQKYRATEPVNLYAGLSHTSDELLVAER
ncbi:MAG: hypothetical protein DMF03_07705 [Verrucomicrobia bacterium]|nr:MAG: hypothetical protein DMF03_07705 [Verrucomicrobiota bacterium]